MELELVFNELSWAHPAVGVDEARACANRFVAAMSEATRRGVKRTVRSARDLQQIELAPGYYWRNWRQDREVRRELREYFVSVTTKYPPLLDEAEIEQDMQVCDYFFGGERAVGLGIACKMDSLALSMLSSSVWDTPLLSLEVHDLRDQEIEQHTEKVRHVGRPEHVGGAHRDWIKRRLASLVEDGRELWDRTAEFFPSLVFCDAVRGHIRGLPKRALSSVMRGLFCLDDYAREWTVGGFDSRQVQCDVSPESESTIKHFAKEREFVCPDGNRLVFSWHAKLGSWRVYFDPTIGPRQLLIGYAGLHLRTAKHR